MSETPVRVAVLGAGAVGCYFGGMFARAGWPVVLVGRERHVEAFRRAGLRFQTAGEDFAVPVESDTRAAAVRGAKLVLFCVKSTDTETAAAELAPHLDADAVVVNLQNGVDNAERIQARVRQPVLPAAVYVATEMAGPGHLRHHGRGDLVVGTLRSAPAELAPRVKAWFEAVGVPTAISPDIRSDLWMKLVVNCAYNAISAIARMPYGRMVEGVGVTDLMRDAVNEVLALARAKGIAMPADTLERVLGIAQAMGAQYSSTAQDLARGRPTEIDHLNGYVVREGAAAGIPVPANRALFALVKLLEATAPTCRGSVPSTDP